MHTVRAMFAMTGARFVVTSGAEKRQVPKPEHIERCQAGGNQANGPQDFAVVRGDEVCCQNCVFAEESGERKAIR